MIEQVKLRHYTAKGNAILSTAIVEYEGNRIYFLKSPFALKDEIKAMQGSRWMQYTTEGYRAGQKIWSIDNCQRNRFNLRYLMGEDVFAWFDRPIERHEYERPLMAHQRDLADAGLTYHYQIFAAEMGVGKGGLPSTKVATPSGWTTLGEITVGDAVVDPFGGVTRVRGVFHRGRMEMFRVTFSDGSSTVCSADHLWYVRSAQRKFRGMPYETLELQEIVRRGLHDAAGNAKHYIPMVTPIEYGSGEHLPVSPYVVGYLLGNGCFRGCVNMVSAPDEETVSRLNSEMQVPLRKKSGSHYDYQIMDSAINAWVESIGLRGCRSEAKFLSDECFFTSFANRVALLQGLCDSDGTPCHAGGVEYCTTSTGLRDSFVALVQSLGGTCSVSQCLPEYTYKGERRTGLPAYRIIASFSSDISPFRLTRKAAKYVAPTEYQPTRAIVNVESVGEDECICISVESENHLYVTDEYIVTHNTLSAQEVIEKSGVRDWWWIGPKTSLPNMRREFRKWDFPFDEISVDFLTYDGLVARMDDWKPGDPIPQGMVADESSRAKTPTAQRTRACQKLADLIREKYGFDGYVIEMSGTPSPKSPLDWWSQCEIAWPGFLREGSQKALEQRLAFLVKKELDSGVSFNQRVGWKDDEKKCAICGNYADDDCHSEMCENPEDFHMFTPSKNEVAYMYDRLKGLVIIKHKKDCLTLPEKRYRRIYCKPSKSTLRAAQAISQAAPSTVIGLTLLRELSDGFQYRDVIDGTTRCTHCVEGKCDEWYDPDNIDNTYDVIDLLDPETRERLVKRQIDCPVCGGSKEVPRRVRITNEVTCPKDDALKMLLDENEEVGRIVIFAGFTGSVDRVQRLCQSEGWDVVKCDGRGFDTITFNGTAITDEEPLDYWGNLEKHPRVAFVAHPESGGMSLTLTEARMAVYWSNSWKPEYRMQSEDRIHRKGMDENLGCTIVDLIHLPSDERVLEVIRANRRLELLTMGEVLGDIKWDDARGAENGVEIEETVDEVA